MSNFATKYRRFLHRFCSKSRRRCPRGRLFQSLITSNFYKGNYVCSRFSVLFSLVASSALCKRLCYRRNNSYSCKLYYTLYNFDVLYYSIHRERMTRCSDVACSGIRPVVVVISHYFRSLYREKAPRKFADGRDCRDVSGLSAAETTSK